MRFSKQGQKQKKQVFAVGDKVCFSIPDSKTRDPIWHVGKVVVLPKENSEGKVTMKIGPFELIDSTLRVRSIEDWETCAPPNFPMPREVLILDRLLSQIAWPEKVLPAVEVDPEKVCIAKHASFLNLFTPPQKDHVRYRHQWGN